MTTDQCTAKIQHRRKIEGNSAVLLPFTADNNIDFVSFASNVHRTSIAGLTPAVNMDTGYANFISDAERTQILALARDTLQGVPFIAGAYIEGQEGATFDLYARAVDEIMSFGGTPIIFQSTSLKALEPAQKIDLYRKIGERCPKFLAFELGEMFLPFGEIYSLDIMRELMQIPQLAGAKHSSLDRLLELQRLEMRDEVRPDFKIYTGNDLAIDLVMYGSDYLLGLSTFHPEAFAVRDRLWQEGDARFYALNDLLQYLGFLAFRPPVPAYKHNAAQFLKILGRIQSDNPHPKGARRPESDIEILQGIAGRLEAMVSDIENSSQ